MKKSLLFLIIFFSNLNGITIGSNTAPSRQRHYMFKGFNNKISGFAVMENGFSFQNNSTTCTFDSFFPVETAINLNGGDLYLNVDLETKSSIDFINSGTIYGNKNYIDLPITDTISIPSNQLGILNLLDNDTLSSAAYSLDWSYDKKYIAITSNRNLLVYYFDGSTITQTASSVLADRIYTLKWQPDTYKIATGRRGSGNRLAIYKWNINNGTLTETTSINPGGTVYGLDWRPDGNYIGIIRRTNNELRVYSYDGSTLSYITQAQIPGSSTRTTYFDNIISWRSDGQYLASAFRNDGTEPEIFIHSFDGTTLTENASYFNNQYARCIDWSKTTSLIAVGLGGSSRRVRIYESNTTNGTIKEKASITTSRTTYAIKWSPDGKYIGIGRYNNADGPEIQIQKYDFNFNILKFITGYELGSNRGYRFKWSKDQKNIATYDNGRILRVFDFENLSPLTIYDTNIIFDSNLNIENEIYFFNNSSISGNNNKINLGTKGKILVYNESKLVLKNLTLNNVKADNIKLLSNSSSIVFDNVKIKPTEDFQLENGAFEILNNLEISGNYTFSYNSNQPSKIKANSALTLKDGIIFSYSPSTTANNLISLEDESSQIILNESTLHATETGLQLIKGKLVVKGKSYINSDANIQPEGIIFGDGINSSNDLKIDIEAESNLSLISGHWAYKNIN